MSNIDQIKSTLVEILSAGILRIRMLGSMGQAEACAQEADHIHNLPRIIEKHDRCLLAHYVNVSRPAFLEITKTNTDQFKSLWEKLDKLIAAEGGDPESAKG